MSGWRSADPVPVLTANLDSDRIVQVMSNLLSNAIKFSPSGETVTVTITRRNGWGRIAVADRGPGIPENFRSRIFQRFSQADSSDTRKAGGTGLGLSIAKTIAERHGGHIGFDSALGVGTTFYFELPTLTRGERATAAPILAAETKADTKADARPKKKHILICEDDPDIAKLVAMLVVRNGMRAEIAPSAEAALGVLGERHFDAMTVDLILPGKDGITLIRELRQNPITQDLPVIVVSACSEDAEQHLTASTLGVIDWLNKPIDEERLRRAVSLATSRNRKTKPRLLYVEDDADLVEVVRTMLGDAVALTVASTVAEARNCLEREVYDLAILDVGMPDGSGLDLLKQLKGDQEEATSVIIFSGEEIGEDLAQMVGCRPGQGSCFQPGSAGNHPPAGRRGRDSARRRKETGIMAPPLTKILIIEDDSDIQTVARMALETVGGFTVEACGSGREAIEMAPRFKPDIILLDVMMPEMDGPTTLLHLRADTVAGATPVIFCTAKAMPTELEHYKALGSAGVIAKPFDPMTLAQQVRDIWNRHHG